MDNRQLRNPNNVWDNREPEQARFDLYMKYREKELAKNDPEYQRYLRNIEKQQVQRLNEYQKRKDYNIEQEVTRKKERERQEFYETCTFKPKINPDKNEQYKYQRSGSGNQLYHMGIENAKRKDEWR